MGNQQSSNNHGNSNGNGNGHNSNNEANHGCIPCAFFLRPLKKTSRFSSDPMGSPLPATPPMQRHKREQVAAAMTSSVGQSSSSSASATATEDFSKATSGMMFLPPKYGSKTTGGNSIPTPSSVAPVHEGPDAEAALHAKYELAEVLGVGSTSTVQSCRLRKTGEQYACKIIDIQQVEERFSGMMEQFQTEIAALRQLSHPGIIRLYDVYMTPTRIYIIMECMQGGELFDYVVQKGTLTEEEASHIVRKVTSALVYMHEQHICHRDLKPENLLLKSKPTGRGSSSSSSEELEVKIIDFGLSKAMEEPVARTFLGTRGYLAPEMLQRRDYTRAVDTWALGVIVFVLLCGCLPFDDDSATVPSDDLVRAKFVLRFPRWAKHLSASAKDLLTHLLDVNPKTRYTADQALRHPWVQGRTASKDSLLQSPGRIGASPAVRNGKKYAPPNREGRLEDVSSPENGRGKVVRKNSL